MRGSAAFRAAVAPGGVLAGPWVRNELWRRARAVPSLDLRFADDKSLRDAVSGQQLITFTRASSGTFVGSDGVLRTAVTNLQRWSEDFTQGLTPANATLTANQGVAPNGTLTADQFLETTANGLHSQEIVDHTFIAGVIYTFSCYAKTIGNRNFGPGFPTLFGSARFGFFDLTGSGSVVSTSAGVTASIQAVGDGWYRCSITSTCVTGGGARVGVFIASGTSISYAGDTTKGLLLWGAQLEQSSTVGEYIPTTSTINSAPRFDHNPTTGESLGLLVEEQRTNLLLQSNGFDTTWTNTESVETANQATAPDGNNSGWKLVNTAVSQGHNIFQFVAWTAVATTVSVFVKYLDHRWVGIRMGAAGNQFFGSWDLQNSVVGSVTAGATIGMQAFGNGWYRLTLTATLTSAGSANLVIGLNNADAVALTSYTGTGTGIYIFGAQVETGAFPTSYIPTTTATVTRSADVASITGTAFSSWYRQDEGTIYADLVTASRGHSSYPRLVAFLGSDVNNGNEASIYTRNIGGAEDYRLLAGYWDAVGAAADFNPGVSAPLGSGRAAMGVKLNDGAYCVNGATVLTDTNCAIPTPIQVRLFGQARFQPNTSGTIKRLVYWPRRLGNEVLQEVTR